MQVLATVQYALLAHIQIQVHPDVQIVVVVIFLLQERLSAPSVKLVHIQDLLLLDVYHALQVITQIPVTVSVHCALLALIQV